MIMDYQLLDQSEEGNYYKMKIQNREGFKKTTPVRGFKKIDNNEHPYVNEVLLSFKSDQFPDGSSYDVFNRNIENKLKAKESLNNINIITFFGDKNTDMNSISKFEDIILLNNFEELVNDNLVTMPFSLKLYDANEYDPFKQSIYNAFDKFSSTVVTKNFLGYIPAYIKYKELDKFFKFYSNKDLGTVRNSGGTYNAMPLYIDFKRSNPDTFKRSVAMLLQLKKKYIREGFYPVFYAGNVGRPRISAKSQYIIAREFLLSFIGFDIIGSSLAFNPREGPRGYTPDNKLLDFNLNTFEYSYKLNDASRVKERDMEKSQIYGNQSSFLGTLNKNNANDELKKRTTAQNYVKAYL